MQRRLTASVLCCSSSPTASHIQVVPHTEPAKSAYPGRCVVIAPGLGQRYTNRSAAVNPPLAAVNPPLRSTQAAPNNFDITLLLPTGASCLGRSSLGFHSLQHARGLHHAMSLSSASKRPRYMWRPAEASQAILDLAEVGLSLAQLTRLVQKCSNNPATLDSLKELPPKALAYFAGDTLRHYLAA